MSKIEKSDIIYEDGNILVAYKNEGIVTDGDKSLTTLVNGYLGEYGKHAEPCHRLDRNTDGLVIFAKNPEAEAEMLQAIKERKIEKFYLAGLKGTPKNKSATLKAYLWKDSKKSTVYIYDAFKKGCVPIETRYKILEQLAGGNCQAEIQLISGRTHQIRAHMAHIGHPVLGDGKYGDFVLNRKLGLKTQQLTAYKIIFHFEGGGLLSYLDGKTIKRG